MRPLCHGNLTSRRGASRCSKEGDHLNDWGGLDGLTLTPLTRRGMPRGSDRSARSHPLHRTCWTPCKETMRASQQIMILTKSLDQKPPAQSARRRSIHMRWCAGTAGSSRGRCGSVKECRTFTCKGTRCSGSVSAFIMRAARRVRRPGRRSPQEDPSHVPD